MVSGLRLSGIRISMLLVGCLTVYPAFCGPKKKGTYQPVAVKREIEPFYPNWAYNNGIGEGFAKVAFYVDENGEASEYLVVEYSHKPFAESLMTVLPKWKFEPAHQYGAPVKSVCHAYWEFLPDRAIVTNALFDTNKRINRGDAHSRRELRYFKESKLDSKLRMIAFPEVVAPQGFDSAKLEDNKVTVRCEFYVDTEGSVALPTVNHSSVPELNPQLVEAFKKAIFERPLANQKPAIGFLEKTYKINVTVD